MENDEKWETIFASNIVFGAVRLMGNANSITGNSRMPLPYGFDCLL